MKKYNSGNTNTILIVIVIIIVVALGVWWYTMRSGSSAAPAESGASIDVNLPGSGGDTTPAPGGGIY